MPEGHVLHRLAGELNEAFGGKRVDVRSPQGRFAVEAAHLNRAVFDYAEAVGKQLFLRFDLPAPQVVHIHLGLIGKFRIEGQKEPEGVVRLRISDGSKAADLRAPQWCRLIDHQEASQVMASLGPDPLRADADPERGFDRVQRSGKSIAALLMDQRIAAGVGNIYRAEVLFRHGLDPRTPGREISKKTWQLLWSDLVDLMAEGVRLGRIDTVMAEHSPLAQRREPRVDPHGGEVYVYRRAGLPCLVCGSEIKISLLEGRNLFWCQRCQRRRQGVPIAQWGD